jgi:hypothetical protein
MESNESIFWVPGGSQFGSKDGLWWMILRFAMLFGIFDNSSLCGSNVLVGKHSCRI